MTASPAKDLLVDPFGRPVNSLRVSVTQRCNFKCFFCHMEGEETTHTECSVGHLKNIVRVASRLGIRKVKLTGGEPLLRTDIVDIVSEIAPYVEEVSMTTNGVLLDKYAQQLRESGLRRVNVSFHSADPETFKRVTGSDDLDRVKKGIRKAISSGLTPLKLNMVVLRGINDAEIPEMVNFSRDIGAILQLIEFQPIQAGSEPYWGDFYQDLRPLEEKLERSSREVRVRELQLRKQYQLSNGGVVEVVRPMHNSGFCMYCTRLRLTSNGRLKPCLMRNDNLVDLVPLLKTDGDDLALMEAFREAVVRREPYWRG